MASSASLIRICGLLLCMLALNGCSVAKDILNSETQKSNDKILHTLVASNISLIETGRYRDFVENAGSASPGVSITIEHKGRVFEHGDQINGICSQKSVSDATITLCQPRPSHAGMYLLVIAVFAAFTYLIWRLRKKPFVIEKEVVVEREPQHQLDLTNVRGIGAKNAENLKKKINDLVKQATDIKRDL